MKSMLRSMGVIVAAGLLLAALPACSEQSGSKSSGAATKQPAKESDKPRTEEKYGFTTESAGG